MPKHECCGQEMEFFGVDGNGGRKYYCKKCHVIKIYRD